MIGSERDRGRVPVEGPTFSSFRKPTWMPVRVWGLMEHAASRQRKWPDERRTR